jgi:Ca2+:H+ antiporter
MHDDKPMNEAAKTPSSPPPFAFFAQSRITWLLVLVPITVLLRHFTQLSDTWIFLLSALGMVPLARLLSEATEQLALHTGASLGALLNVTFGNAGELVIGFFALRHGLQNVVKASITGSILMNLLLTLGISMVAGGLRQRVLHFNPLQARSRATMMALAAIGLIFPAAYHWLGGSRAQGREADLSLEFSIILLVTYLFSLLFTLRTHRDLLAAPAEEGETPHWGAGMAGSMLAVSALGIAVMGEVLVGSIEAASHAMHMSDLFAGIIVVAIAGNAAEATSAIRAAMRNRMDLSVGIASGSSMQIALFVAPGLVLLSHFVGAHPMNLVFTPVELLALVVAITIHGQIAGDGDANWMEGVQLLAVYCMLAVMFYLLPPL